MHHWPRLSAEEMVTIRTPSPANVSEVGIKPTSIKISVFQLKKLLWKDNRVNNVDDSIAGFDVSLDDVCSVDHYLTILYGDLGT